MAVRLYGDANIFRPDFDYSADTGLFVSNSTSTVRGNSGAGSNVAGYTLSMAVDSSGGTYWIVYEANIVLRKLTETTPGSITSTTVATFLTSPTAAIIPELSITSGDTVGISARTFNSTKFELLRATTAGVLISRNTLTSTGVAYAGYTTFVAAILNASGDKWYAIGFKLVGGVGTYHIVVIDVATLAVLSSFALTGTNPSFANSLRLSPDGGLLYVSHRGNGGNFSEVDEYNLGTGLRTRTFNPLWVVGGDVDAQTRIAIEDDGSYLYASRGGFFAAFRLSDGVTVYSGKPTGVASNRYSPISVLRTPVETFFASCIDPTNALWTAEKASTNTQLYMTRKGTAARETKAVITGVEPVAIAVGATVGKVLVLGSKSGSYKLFRSYEYGKTGTFQEVGVEAFSATTHEKASGAYIGNNIFAAIAVEKATKKLQTRYTKNDGVSWSTTVDIATLTTSEQYEIERMSSGQLRAFSKGFGKVYGSSNILGASGSWSVIS